MKLICNGKQLHLKPNELTKMYSLAHHRKTQSNANFVTSFMLISETILTDWISLRKLNQKLILTYFGDGEIEEESKTLTNYDRIKSAKVDYN